MKRLCRSLFAQVLVALVAGIAPGAAWATLHPAACGRRRSGPPGPAGAPWATSPFSNPAGSCQAVRSSLPHLVAMARPAPWPWHRSGAPFNGW